MGPADAARRQEPGDEQVDRGPGGNHHTTTGILDVTADAEGHRLPNPVRARRHLRPPGRVDPRPCDERQRTRRRPVPHPGSSLCRSQGGTSSVIVQPEVPLLHSTGGEYRDDTCPCNPPVHQASSGRNTADAVPAPATSAAHRGSRAQCEWHRHPTLDMDRKLVVPFPAYWPTQHPARSTRAACAASPRIRGELGQRVESALPARNESVARRWRPQGFAHGNGDRGTGEGSRSPPAARSSAPFPVRNGGKEKGSTGAALYPSLLGMTLRCAAYDGHVASVVSIEQGPASHPPHRSDHEAE